MEVPAQQEHTMPRHTRPTYTALLPVLLLAFLLLSGCRKETQPAQATPDLPEAGSGVYVSITVTADGGFSPSSSRTGVPGTRVPNPGEDGDGEQPGTGDENMVHDINVFFLQTKDGKGLNTTDGASAVNVMSAYFDNLSPDPSGTVTTYTTQAEEVEGLAIGGTYDVLVIANAGNISSKIKTLEDLRNHAFDSPITDDTEKHFLMASSGSDREGNSDVDQITVIANNSPYNPATVSVCVERLAARVDYHLAGEGDATGKYKVGETGDYVQILGAALANKYAGSTYAFKRVTDGLVNMNSFIYLGDETTADGTGTASNYVVDTKWSAGGANNPELQYDQGFTSTDWSGTSTSDTEDDFADWKSAENYSNGITSEHDGVTYHLLDYTSENVVPADIVGGYYTVGDGSVSGLAMYCTGVVFKAQYLIDGNEANDNGEYNVYWYEGRAYSSIEGIGDENITDENYADHGVLKYPDGICYYTYWIRHADDGDPDKISPMEYATVRNNIYQLNVTSISGIGTPEPEDNIRADIEVYVVNWNKIETEDIVWGDSVND